MSTATEPLPVPAEVTPKSSPTVGPDRHGLAMDFDEFIRADFEEGWFYELARGIVMVTEVPGINHGRTVLRVNKLCVLYDVAHPGFIDYQAGGGECRLRLPGMKSDRHPDQAIYLRTSPKGPRLWERWVPDLVVEIVSERGQSRDYVEKREEYLAAGIREYWILDLKLRRLLVLLNRDGAWRDVVIGEDGIHRSEVLPGLEVRVGDLLGPPEEDD